MPASRPPQQLRAKRTRRHLLAAARRVLAERGYADATIDDVAREAGCSKGAYYFHFASKEDVLLAVVDDWIRDCSQRLTKVATGTGAAGTALIDTLEALLVPDDGTGWEPGLLLEIWSQGQRNREVGRRLAEAQRRWRELLIQTFRRAQEAGALPADVTPESAAAVALALHGGLVIAAPLPDPPTRESLGAALALLAGPTTLRRSG